MFDKNSSKPQLKIEPLHNGFLVYSYLESDYMNHGVIPRDRYCFSDSVTLGEFVAQFYAQATPKNDDGS